MEKPFALWIWFVKTDKGRFLREMSVLFLKKVNPCLDKDSKSNANVQTCLQTLHLNADTPVSRSAQGFRAYTKLFRADDDDSFFWKNEIFERCAACFERENRNVVGKLSERFFLEAHRLNAAH